jgi:hypothetical protein
VDFSRARDLVRAPSAGFDIGHKEVEDQCVLIFGPHTYSCEKTINLFGLFEESFDHEGDLHALDPRRRSFVEHTSADSSPVGVPLTPTRAFPVGGTDEIVCL